MATLCSHEDIVQFQIGVRFVRDGDGRGRVGLQIPCADEVIGLHIDIAAAGGDVRDFHIVHRTAGVDICRNFAACILLHQPQACHLVLYSGTLCDIGCHHRNVFSSTVIGGNQFVQLFQTRAQAVGIVKGSLCNTVHYPLVCLVFKGIEGQPACDSTANGHIDGSGSAGDESTGHFDLALFHLDRGLFRRNRIGRQELLVRAGAAIDPCPLARVLDNFFFAAVGDGVDVPCGAHCSAHIHNSLVSGDVIRHIGDSDGDDGIVVGPCLEVHVQVGMGAASVSSRIKSHVAAAFNGTRNRHIARAVHRSYVLGNERADNAGQHRGVGMGFQGLIIIGAQVDVLRGGRLFIAESCAGVYGHRIVNINLVLGDRVRDHHSASALGLHMVREVVLGGCDVFLQIGGRNLRVFTNNDIAIFRDIQQTPQTVAGNNAAEMIFQGKGLHVLCPTSVCIVIGSGGNSVRRANMDAVSGDFCTVFHRGLRVGYDRVFHAGAAHTRNASMTFRGRQARLILLGSEKPDFTRYIPFAAEGAVYSVRRFVVHMGAHIAHDPAAARVCKGLARVIAICHHHQAGQLVRGLCIPRKGACQRLFAADIRAGVAYSHGAGGDVMDIRLAIHMGLVIQDEFSVLAKDAVGHIDRGSGNGIQDDRVGSDSYAGDVMPLHITF